MRIDVAFGQRVRELRKRCGLTQAELAERSPGKLDMQSVSKIELGDRNCTLDTIANLATGLGCEPAELFLFDPKNLEASLTLLDARIADLWKAADEPTKQKAIRILSELL